MNGGLLLGMSFFDKIGTFFDIIPKIIYFLSAVFLSAIDVLQCLIRKLAGLDVYYVKQAGTTDLEAVAKNDPLSEFVYGILGMGDSAALYKGLNTVFWSLTVFAIICLAVTTMIAIIKSHYNEDVGATSPWKYIYTAIKAVFTFAIVPFAVIIGMELASWTLQTLDSITAGSATEEAIVSTYGNQAAKAFEAGTLDGDDTKYYSRYDFFGAGMITSSTPFSGMLFKACSYDASRARAASEFADVVCELETTDGNKIFGQTGDTSATVIADQIDYAFMNNLRFSDDGYSVTAVQTHLVGAGVKYWEATDFINGLGRYTKGFSKWNVGFVWMFYNLWSYNFIVAFGGGVTIMGIMLSVIIGLMSRLMKGAVLFLIYPALLGIAPLDNFKAFKSWTSQFIQQVMMAFGAIIGMNLTLLVLPYVQNIRFFNIAVVDNIVNIVLVMTALMMMKDIISMISAFAGGADANNVGSGLKGEVGKAIATGAKVAGVTGVAATAGVGALAVKGGRGIVRGARTLLGERRGGSTRAMNNANNKVQTAQANRNNKAEAFDKALYEEKDNSAGLSNLYDEIYSKSNMQGKTSEQLNKEWLEASRKYYNENKKEFSKDVETAALEEHNAELDLEKAKAKQKRVADAFHFREHDDGSYEVNDRVGLKERIKDSASGSVKNFFQGGLKDGYTRRKNDAGKWEYFDNDGDRVLERDARKGFALVNAAKFVG